MTPTQLRMARAALRIGVRELAAMSGLSPMTISRFENGHTGGRFVTIEGLRVTLVARGITFLPPTPEGGAGVIFTPGIEEAPHEPR